MSKKLTDHEIKEKAFLIESLDSRFEFGVLEFLKREKAADLYILSDFYYLCLDLLGVVESTKSYKCLKNKIQYRLGKMKDKNLIDWRRTGTGFLGKSDFGSTSMNTYTLPDFWL